MRKWIAWIMILACLLPSFASAETANLQINAPQITYINSRTAVRTAYEVYFVLPADGGEILVRVPLAGGDAVLVYQARANTYADPAVDGTIDNTVIVTGNGLNVPATATETVTASAAPLLTVSKSITPAQVVDNDRVTYTFVIQNSGNEAVVATDNAAITDIFDPILTDLVVSFNGTVWTEGVQYNYDEATGLFTTVPGEIVVPAATYTRDPVTGTYSVTPGIATLVVTGTI